MAAILPRGGKEGESDGGALPDYDYARPIRGTESRRQRRMDEGASSAAIPGPIGRYAPGCCLHVDGGLTSACPA